MNADRYHELLTAAGLEAALEVAGRVAAELPEGARVLTWQDLNRGLFFALKLEKAVMFASVLLIVLVAALSLVTVPKLTVVIRKLYGQAYLNMGGGAYSDVYDNAIRRENYVLDRVLRHLAREGYLEKTLVVIGSDHGEAFGEHGRYGHNTSVHREMTHVPVVLHPRELVAGTVAHLGADTGRLDSLWGVFDGSDASWVFLDSAAVHWSPLRGMSS